MKIPAHVVLTLVEQGVMFADGASRNARFGYCRKCRELVVRGLDHDRSALLVTADPYPLSPVGEVGALFSKRTTYDLVPHGAYDYRLNPRYVDEIRARAAGTGGGDVVAVHICGAPRLDTTESRIRAIPKPSNQGDNTCPF